MFRELAIVFLGRNESFSESYCGAKWHKSRNMAEQTARFFNLTVNGRSSMKGQQLFTCSIKLNWRREHCVIWCSTCGTVICFHLFQCCSLFQRFLQNAECTICSWTNSFSLNANLHSLELLWHDARQIWTLWIYFHLTSPMRRFFHFLMKLCLPDQSQGFSVSVQTYASPSHSDSGWKRMILRITDNIHKAPPVMLVLTGSPSITGVFVPVRIPVHVPKKKPEALI